MSVPAFMVHDPATPRVEFLGLFDTVGSLGVPLWGWWFQALPLPQWKNVALLTNPMTVCRHVFHAMAMDERQRLRLKPQNLLLNLPLAQNQ